MWGFTESDTVEFLLNLNSQNETKPDQKSAEIELLYKRTSKQHPPSPKIFTADTHIYYQKKLITSTLCFYNLKSFCYVISQP